MLLTDIKIAFLLVLGLSMVAAVAWGTIRVRQMFRQGELILELSQFLVTRSNGWLDQTMIPRYKRRTVILFTYRSTYL
ncbi:MAG TPA: hypothetical protein VMT30_01235 [Candidatus Saccharimonadia bacterium]|nr:hypothetical protein [Candidatus Saccharimonadia bacterium]